jgi:Zn-dependent peptidase ImmA (M78 family)
MGILAVEIPAIESIVEGCSFYVGSAASPRPCVFANNHHTTWFRRNAILTHEVGHAIFEPFTGATLDLVNDPAGEDIEMRAQSFAQEVLVPREVLLHAAQSIGCKWNAMNADSLARLVSLTHVEARTLLSAAQEEAFLDGAQVEELKRIDISSTLRNYSDHALTTEEYLGKKGVEEQEWIGKRTTTLTARPIRLPIGYVNTIVEAYQNRQISPSRGAAYMMIDETEFLDRFGDVYEEVDV